MAATLSLASCGGNGGSGASSAEAEQASAGDIPDNQVFLTFDNAKAGYSIKYPEGWAQQGDGDHVTFRDKDNVVRIDVVPGGKVSNAGVVADARAAQAAAARAHVPDADGGDAERLAGGQGRLHDAERAEPGHGQAREAHRRPVRRPRAGKHAVIDLGTPEGVDNVDAYRLMSESFRWR